MTLEYSLPTASDVTIALYDIAGRRMTTLLNGSQDQGMHQLSWNSGSLKRGMYFIRLQAGAVPEWLEPLPILGPFAVYRMKP